MSEKKKKTPSTEPPREAAPDAERKASEEPSAKKSSYVFKIVPADPKNSFDFEDVADK